MGIVEEETDESILGMELLVETGIMSQERRGKLSKEANEILAIVLSSIKTAKNRITK